MDNNQDVLFTQVVTGSCLVGFVLLAFIARAVKVVQQFFM